MQNNYFVSLFVSCGSYHTYRALNLSNRPISALFQEPVPVVSLGPAGDDSQRKW